MPPDVDETFVDPGGGPLRLLVETESPSAGETFRVAPLNETSHAYLYGVHHRLERFEAGEWVPSEAFNASHVDIGLFLPARSLGPCLTVDLDSETPAGRYRIVLRLLREPAGKAGAEVVWTEIEVSEG
jgi:hypothetical protein